MNRADVKRRTFHREQIAKATTPRMRLWAAWRWPLAEANRAGEDGRDRTAKRLEEIATELNGADR